MPNTFFQERRQILPLLVTGLGRMLSFVSVVFQKHYSAITRYCCLLKEKVFALITLWSVCNY